MPFQPNENLTAALRGTLRIVEAEAKREVQVPSPEQPIPTGPSPLSEVEANSLDEEIDRINQHFIDGTPEKITDDALDRAIDRFRAEALKWEQDEQTKKSKARTTTKRLHVEAMEL
jgi:hypothetical protein